jgi:hypothetical protein
MLVPNWLKADYDIALAKQEKNADLTKIEKRNRAFKNSFTKYAKRQQRLGLAHSVSQTYQEGDVYSLFDEGFLGVVLWRGPSAIDGKEIVVLASFSSINGKTGPMVQITIVLVDISPTVAVKQNCDASICGDCPHRINRTCYVKVFHGPRSSWQAFANGRYATFNGDYTIFDGYKVRFGAYGDPALLPIDIVRNITEHCAGWTGYTHQWDNVGSEYRMFFQASCDSLDDKERAKAMGWGTFTVTPMQYDVRTMGKVTICPAALSDNIQCIDCGKCNGATKFAMQIVIPAHGRGAKKIQWA